MLKLALANIAHRKVRSAVTVLAVAIGVAMLLVLVGMTEGSLREVARRMQGVGADIIVHPEDVNPILDSTTIMPLKAMDILQNVPGVEAVAPVVLDRITLKNRNQRVFGIEVESFRRVGAGLEIIEGRLWSAPNEIVIDRRLAEGLGYRVGDRINRLGRELKIVGICEANNGARVLMPMTTLQAARHSEGRASFFMVKCERDPGDAGEVGAVASAIEKALTSVRAKTLLLRDYSHELRRNFRGLHEFIAGVIVVCLTVSFLVIFLVLYVNVLERSREVAILKALGASRLDVVTNVLAESLMLCAGGVIAGLLITVGARWIMGRTLPLLTVDIMPGWVLAAVAITLAGGTLGAMYPAVRAARLDPEVPLNFE